MSLKFWQIKLFIVLGFIALASGIGLTKLFISFHDLKDLEQTDAYAHYAVPSKLYDIKGRLITEFYKEKRDLVSFNDLPQNLIRAIIATEDNSFYEHGGANFGAMFQGVIIDPLRGRGIRGGSGLTQQLSKQMFTKSEYSIQRKLIELWYAFQLEKKYSKEEILELYFNLIYFGHGQYGVQSASKFYFNKLAKDLSLGEASFLAGLPQAPSRYSPIINYELAQARHQVVLTSMIKSGHISQQLANQTFTDFWSDYDNTFVAATRNIKSDADNDAPFFAEYVRQQILDKYGEDLLYEGGLEIHTTLDLDYQIAANEEMEKVLASEQASYSSHYNKNYDQLRSNYIDILDLVGINFGMESFTFGETRVKTLVKNIVVEDQDLLSLTASLFGLDTAHKEIEKLYQVENLVSRKTDSVEGALISINPHTGYIQSMVGGRNFNVANQFNRATQAQRQMGSIFKSLVFAIALDNKTITPSEIFIDEIISYRLPDGGAWTPRNYSGTYQGATTVRKALRSSINIITILIWERMLKQIGYSRIIERLGLFLGESDLTQLEKRIPNEMATSLGTGTASPLTVAQAYSVFANGGKTVTPISVLKVYDRNGKLLDDFQTAHAGIPQNQVISEPTALLMQNLLNDVIIRGTGSGAARRTEYEFRTQTAGKSGTSANWTDAWFAGFTDDTTSIIWVGLDSSSKSLGRGRSSALVAAPPWFSYMNRIGKLKTPGTLAYSTNKTGLQAAYVSPYTGLLTTASDPLGYTEYFLQGTAPQTYGNPQNIALIQAQFSQENNYTVSGESINLEDQIIEESTMIDENPYVLDNDLSADLDLSFDLSSGL